MSKSLELMQKETKEVGMIAGYNSDYPPLKVTLHTFIFIKFYASELTFSQTRMLSISYSKISRCKGSTMVNLRIDSMPSLSAADAERGCPRENQI